MARDGFIIPNAETYAPDYQTSQPDQGDFLILGNAQYGVIAGCKVSLSAETTASVSTGPHILLVDGELYQIGDNLSVSIPGKGALPRFDLVVFDTATDPSPGLRVVSGTPATNPVFPDITSTITPLAAVFVPASGGSTTAHIIDKRNIIQTSLTALDTDNLIRNYASNGTGIRFNIDGSGKVSWGTSGTADTHLERLSAGVLKATDEIRAANFKATASITVNDEEVITTETIDWGTGAARPVSADIGDIYVNNQTGSISVWKPENGTEQWVTLQPNVPAGTVIQSFVPEARMPGWLLLNGQTVAKANVGNLWDLFKDDPAWRPTVNEELVLPNLTGRFPVGAGGSGGSPGTLHGSLVGGNPTGLISVTLAEAQLPPHTHQTSPNNLQPGFLTGVGGGHDHSGTVNPGGAHAHVATAAGSHSHPVNDPGHAHGWNGGWPIVSTLEEPDSCVDAVFTDLNHMWRTIAVPYSTVNQTNIGIGTGGTHTHPTDQEPAHTHSFTTSPHGGHQHTLPTHSVIGQGRAIEFRPPSISLYFYIKI